MYITTAPQKNTKYLSLNDFLHHMCVCLVVVSVYAVIQIMSFNSFFSSRTSDIGAAVIPTLYKGLLHYIDYT